MSLYSETGTTVLHLTLKNRRPEKGRILKAKLIYKWKDYHICNTKNSWDYASLSEPFTGSIKEIAHDNVLSDDDDDKTLYA